MTVEIDELEDYVPTDYAVMSVFYIKGKPMYESAIMKECIERYGDLIEHDRYYSNDVDEAIEGLRKDGVLRIDPSGRTYKISLTDYGSDLFKTFLHNPVEGEDLEAMKEAILGGWAE